MERRRDGERKRERGTGVVCGMGGRRAVKRGRERHEGAMDG